MTLRIENVDDDGLVTPEVGGWAVDKYRLLQLYATLFSTAMKGKWTRIYLDLFAGAGHARIKNTNRIVPASPMLAATIQDPFDKYIFCDKQDQNISALEHRIRQLARPIDATYLIGDANDLVEAVVSAMPRPSSVGRVLTFCFADPYALENLAFATIEELARKYIDFLILIPTGMDAVRNLAIYKPKSNSTVERFLGLKDWRGRWQAIEQTGANFGSFVVDCYGEQMSRLDYRYGGISMTQEIRSTDKNLPLYRLAFFSRSELGEKFWKESLKYSDDQLTFF